MLSLSLGLGYDLVESQSAAGRGQQSGEMWSAEDNTEGCCHGGAAYRERDMRIAMQRRMYGPVPCIAPVPGILRMGRGPL